MNHSALATRRISVTCPVVFGCNVGCSGTGIVLFVKVNRNAHEIFPAFFSVTVHCRTTYWCWAVLLSRLQQE